MIIMPVSEPHSPKEALVVVKDGVLSSAITKASPSLPASSSAAAVARSTPASKPAQSIIAVLPEAAGLPYDEAYGYLCLLRRYIVYGPSLNLSTASPATTATPAADGHGGGNQVGNILSFPGVAMTTSMQPSHLTT